MRKIIVLSMISLDGVMQAPGGPQEDTSGGFEFGGWAYPHSDEVYDKVVQQELQPADYLLGRKTFEIWANYWPQHAEYWPGINVGAKYVFSKNLKQTDTLITGWKNSTVIQSVADIQNIKNSDGPDIQVWGSSKLVQMLLQNDLVDELKLKIHPIILGKGKKLFNDAALPASFILTDNVITPRGVIIADYKRAGQVETGDFGV